MYLELIDRLSFIREYSREHYAPIMLESSAEVLYKAVKERQPVSILEIGTSIGYTGALMLLATSICASLNTIEYNEGTAAIAKRNFNEIGLSKRVNVFIGDAKEIVPILNGGYDLIFLDGPKGQYITFLPHLLRLMTKGSVLVCDNVLFRGIVESLPDKRHRQTTLARRLSEFLVEIKTNPKLKTIVYDIGDGVSVSIML